MEYGKILASIKGKVLDAAHFELLKSAYDLQAQNLEQLQANNAALKESNDLLKEKAGTLAKQCEQLKVRVAELEARLAAAAPEAKDVRFSETATAILTRCVKQDITDFYAEEMIEALPITRMEVEVAIDELEAREVLELGSIGPRGPRYVLTEIGMRRALDMKNNGA